MDAWLEIPVGDISTWSSATFSFYTWYVTGSWSLADYLRVLNSSDGTSWWVQWTQTQLSSSGWQQVSFSLSTTTTSVAFWFISDPTVGLGPYEGVYLDDLVVTVTDSQNPASSVSSLSSYQTTSSFSVPYTASDLGGSGLAYVELYYRLGTSGAFTLYTTVGNPSGHWTASPIEFDTWATAGDGSYQFYTRAVDTLGNQEAPPPSLDATTTVDTAAPSTTVDFSGTLGLEGRYTSPVSITLDSLDETSGVASTFYQIDSENQQTYSGSFSISEEGAHIVYFHSVDNAGNVEGQQHVYVYVDTQPPTTPVQLLGTLGANGWYVGDSVNVELLSGDYGSYVNSTKYRIDNGTWQTYSGSRITIDKEGTTVIDYYAVDAAGNVESQQSISFKLDSTGPAIAVRYPLPDSKISDDSVTIEWSGVDYVSEIDHYEVQIDGGNWIPLGTATSYELKGLQDKWYGVTVKAVDKSGNAATSTVSFGIYTSVWSQNGPYQGIPLYAVIAATILGAVLTTVVYWRRKGSTAKPPPQEPPQETQ
jgi:hypothetical protein